MARYLIEVPHDENKLACANVVQIFLRTGSHFLSNADWGCMDGDHKAWFIIDVDSKEEARAVVPPPFRHLATIRKLNKFSIEDVEEILLHHTDVRKTA
ncbi:MAG TPA: hypothetical protein VIV15_12895 [Anaerolineales bacterium]